MHEPPLRVRVRTSERLHERDLERIEDQVELRTGRDVRLSVDIDPAALGGISVQARDLLVDGTVRTRLAFLYSRMEKATAGLKDLDALQEFAAALRRVVAMTQFPPAVEHVGTVLSVSDGIARTSGLDMSMMGELVKFPDGTHGMVLSLERNEVYCVVLGSDENIREGQTVRSTGRIMNVAVGRALLGRVVNVLGVPIDEGGPIVPDARSPVEAPAPGIADRSPVREPLSTGVTVVDAMVPIGRGQRELIIGDRQTGKTSLAIDAITNQRGRGVYCVYVAIGQKATAVARTVDILEQAGAMPYTTVVVATSADPAPLQFLAPYSGAAMAEHWMYSGRHALVVYDDLTRHAQAYRTMSLLLRRPPGREAYPGDIFYLHARLLERAVKHSENLGGGSVTALPIVETLGGDVSGYIPTNIISITDGQIFLDPDLFLEGVRPAVNPGLSVSRVGGDAQVQAMKDVAGRLRLDLARYRELLTFTQVGTELDVETRRTLTRGARLVELLKQRPLEHVPTEDQVIMIWAGVNGLLDHVPVESVRESARRFVEIVKRTRPAVARRIREGAKLAESLRDLEEAAREFRRSGGEAVRGEEGRGGAGEARDRGTPGGTATRGWDLQSAEGARRHDRGR
ncbi:MAG: F0F1 ATP synthase subunit alpha [Firmicutes bacterium]|jgi:F-type H+-transporting ATPase subunit alpha|nr:F0F1 ATP synthase subunit alpha [Bacillota bacterium]